MSQFPNSMPGIGSALQLIPRTLFIMDTQTTMDFLPAGKVIDGYSARDPGNTIRVDELRPGLILGKIANTDTASGSATAAMIGAYAASVIGALTGAITSATTQTSITVSLTSSVELVRRVGSSGTLVITGPPTAGGTTVSNTMAYSAVAVTTGVITVTAPGVAYVAGSWIGANDGSAVPLTVLCGTEFPLRVTDTTGANMSIPLALIPITTKPYYTTNIINYPSSANTGLIAYLKTKLRIPVPGATFDDDF